jgi:hypothetical protein
MPTVEISKNDNVGVDVSFNAATNIVTEVY